MTNYIRTYSGLAFPTKPDRRFVSILDIAHGLAQAPRWGGHCRLRYPVVAHSIYTSLIVPPEHRRDALLHDASEAYFCDMPKPFKELLPDYKKVEHGLMVEISTALNFRYPLHPLIKEADAAALYLERKHLFNWPVGNDVPKVLPRIKVKWDFAKWEHMSVRQLEREFLKYYSLYTA